jgi:hypothetical protein
LAASFVFELDTRAPGVQWGPVHDAIAGELLRVEYLLDEPGLQSAEVELRDGRRLAMEVQATQLVVPLPEDAPEGQALVRAITRDDVWNQATYTLAVPLVGASYEEPAAPVPATGGMPVVQPVIITTESRCGTRSAYSATAVATTRTLVRTRSTYSKPGFREKLAIHARARLRTPPDELSVAVVTSTRVQAAGGVAKLGNTATRVTKRPEGPDAEAELIALGIL